MEHPVTKNDYICRILDAYRRMPGTTGAVRPNDRFLAANLYDRGVPLYAVENALVLAVARRITRPSDRPALQPVRSLYYLCPVIDEVLAVRESQNYYRDLQLKIDQVLKLKTLISQLQHKG